MTEEKLDFILRNVWERYDVKKMRRLKAAVVAGVLAVLWFIIFFLVVTINMPSFGDLALIAAVLATITVIAVGIVAGVRFVQVDSSKKDWYFSGLQHEGLRKDEVLGLARTFLTQHGYARFREDTKTTLRLSITFFDVEGADFRMRVWFSEALTPPIAEIGFGPETMLNKAILSRLMTDMSNLFSGYYK